MKTCLMRWGAKIVRRPEFQSDFVALLPLNGRDHLLALHINSRAGTLLQNLDHNFACGVEFQIVVISDEAVRNQISSHLFHNLPKPRWSRAVIISPSQVYSAFRHAEEIFESGSSFKAADATNGDSMTNPSKL